MIHIQAKLVTVDCRGGRRRSVYEPVTSSEKNYNIVLNPRSSLIGCKLVTLCLYHPGILHISERGVQIQLRAGFLNMVHVRQNAERDRYH
jgi:hypothetical protein